MRAAIIGGGLGGLATALRLRARGWDVTVCEAGQTFGGKMNIWRQNGYSFDTGPSLLTMIDVFRDIYAAAGERIEEHLELMRIDPHAEYRFPDGARIVCPGDFDAWREEIRRVDPGDLDGFDRLHALSRKLYELSNRTFFRRSPLSPPRFSELTALRYLPVLHGWGNYARTVSHFLRNPYLQQIYNRYPTYVGSSPYLCPATLLVIPFIEREFGGWYVRGGLYTLVESLVGLARQRGIDLRCASRVAAIERDGGRVRGVRLESGERIAADVVVMNGDAATADALLGTPATEDVRSRSLSGLVLLRGVAERPPGLGHHTVFFSADYRTEFDDLFIRRAFPLDPTVYISAPEDGRSLFVMANAPADGEKWTPADVDTASCMVLAKLYRAGLDLGEPEVSDVFDPGRLARQYAAPGGAIYGTHSHGWKHAFFRPPNRSATVRGLYFVGGSTHPGGGTPTVLLSAKITTEMIQSDAGV